MKTQNWKYASITKIMATACAAGFLLFATSAKAALGKEVLTFDNLNVGGGDLTIANGYSSLNWDNFYALDGVDYGGTNGYTIGVISPKNVAYNGYGSPAAIYSDRFAFILNSAYMMGAWDNNLQVRVDGYFGNRRVYSRTYTLSAIRPTRIIFPSALVTEVDFTSFGGTPYWGSAEHFVADNVTVFVFPLPVRPVSLHLPVVD